MPAHLRDINEAPGGLKNLAGRWQGVLGSEVPTIGPPFAILANDVAAFGWASNRVRVRMLTSNFPAGFFVFENSSYDAPGLVTGNSYTATFRVEVDGVVQTPDSTLTVENGLSSLSGAAVMAPMTAGGGFVSLGISTLTGAAEMAPMSAGGGFVSVASGTLTGAAEMEPMTASGMFGQVVQSVLSGAAEMAPMTASGSLRSVVVGSFTAALARTLVVLPGDVRVHPGSEISLLRRSRPSMDMDRDAVIDVGFDWAGYLAGTGVSLDQFELRAGGGLVVVEESQGGSSCAALVMTQGVYEWGTITARMISAGSPVRVDERTVYVRIIDK